MKTCFHERSHGRWSSWALLEVPDREGPLASDGEVSQSRRQETEQAMSRHVCENETEDATRTGLVCPRGGRMIDGTLAARAKSGVWFEGLLF